MARQLFDNGLFNVLSAAGALGVGWKLHLYTGGTASRITTYNARTAGSANTNPVVADANGRFDEVWIEEGQTIKWILTDATEAVKVTVDDFLLSAASPTIAAGLLTFLAGSAALPVGSGGTGATSAATAIVNLGGLPLTGGTMTGDIARSGKGDHLYFSTSTLTNAEVFLTASGASDPRGGLPGQIWLKY